MLQKIRNHFITKWVAIGIIPGFLLPFTSYAEINNSKRATVVHSKVRAVTNQSKLKKDVIEEIAEAEFGTKQLETDVQQVVASVGGPSDANYSGSAGSSEFVDLSTGDFSYSIPLMDVGGYPLTLSYDANVTMDQQASMVGLGWSLSTGAINRVVRGIPDDFNGDLITTTMNLRPQLTVTNEFSINAEVIGFDVLDEADISGSGGIDVGYTFNNYTGNESSIGGSGSFGIGKNLKGSGPKAFLGGGLNSSSRSGLSSNLALTLAFGADKGAYSSSLGINRNSLHGSSLNTSFGYTAKTKPGKLGLSLNGTFSLGMQSYTPTATFEFSNKSWTLDVAAGYEVPWVALHGGYARTKSTVCLKEQVKSQPAYGYMNQQNGYASNAIQDFNINLGEVHEEVSGVNTPMPTNDYFIVSGAGMFRAIRNDAGYVKNPTTISDGDTKALGGDFAVGVWPVVPFTTFEAGVNVNYNWNNSVAGNWLDNNPLSGGANPDFAFSDSLPDGTDEEDALYEDVLLQKVNSRGSSSDDRYNGMRTDRPLRQEIAKELGEIVGKNSMTSDNADPLYYPNANSYYQTERRNQNEVLINETNRELRLSDEAQMVSYLINDFTYENGSYEETSPLERTELKYPDHHIGQLTMIGTGGFKQVYGLPVMNESDQVSFNVSQINKNESAPDPIVGGDGLVSYQAGVDNSLNNDRGANNYYMKNHVPTHATSYLLTEQLSDNYTDLTGNGPTPDDYGSYTKINYSFLGQNQWRFPFEASKATFNEGFKSDSLDDMASYAYGKRDDWLIHSIETKNYIAEFSYSPREDAYSVANEDGIGLGDPSQRLNEIRLYSRQGKERGENPLKTVHFTYDYELCPETPDNPSGGGKLTLKEVYFEGQDSPEGKLHKYKFAYASNAPYNPSQVDRWGNYQTGNPIDHDALSQLDNGEYPYTNQDIAQADLDARKWKLSTIDLPTGSRIEIKYEADQYKYVQNQEATRMFKIDGFYASEESPEDDKPAYSDFSDAIFDPDSKDQEYFYMVVNLDGTIAGTETEALSDFENHYLSFPQGSDRYIYFNALINLAPHNDGIVDPDIHEYIQGYAKLVNNGWYLLETSPGSEVWNRVVYQVHPEHLDEGKPTKGITHPVSRATWRVIKEALPLVLYPEDNLQAIYAKDGMINCEGIELEDGETDPDLSDDSKNHKKNMKSIRSIYHMMRNTGFGSRAIVDLDDNPATSDSKCWVRMRPGAVAKVGGGHRVKEIRMFDDWNVNVPTENSSEYGIVYDYTIADTTLSSGVATYEPLPGGDEISLRRPNFFIHNQKGAPSEKFYTEFPLNEEVYASTNVGYSNVRVRSISYAGLEMMVPGYTDHKFFTAKDYPVRMSNTNISAGTELRKPGILGLIGISKRRLGLTFGTNIITNDMHRKFKAKEVYSQNGSLIYKMEHTYHEQDGKLVNVLPTIFSDGTLDEDGRIIGQHTDFLTFVNKSESNFSSIALKVQAEIAPPSVTPSAYPSASTFENTIYTSLTSKITYQTGIIDSIYVEDNGRGKYTTNLFYDAKSGGAIVSEIIPEKGDGIRKMYDYSYPAYWKYEELGLDSDNARLQRLNITGSDAIIETAEEAYFNVGDKISVFEYEESPQPRITVHTGDYWVIENEATGELFLADKDGLLFVPDGGTDYRFRVVDPGNKNSTSAAMANVSSLAAPSGSPYSPGYPHTKVISISGIELFEDAKLGGTCVNSGTVLNPYRHNVKGQWKLKHSYSFDGKRDYSTTNSRVDGCLTTYQPFWQNQGGTWMAIDDPARTGYNPSDPYQDWIQNGEATVHNEFGFGLESRNALGLNSTAGVGYNHSYSMYNAVNARYQEITFDGFEDYETNGIYDAVTDTYTSFPCQERHMEVSAISLSDVEAHTGKYSYIVDGPNDGTFYGTVWDGVPAASVTHTSPFVLAPSEEIEGFRLINDGVENRYVLSVWARETTPSNPIDYDDAGVSITIDGTLVTPISENRSAIIDGWQRIEIIFDVDASAADGSLVEIKLQATLAGVVGEGVYYDDLRIHPFDSEMKAQVTDPVKQRITATLDSRNFATIYQYDENGALVRISQETEQGVQTIKENRLGIVLND